MYQMYHWCQYILYCTNIGLIVDWSDVCLIVWNGFILVGVISINVNQVRIFVIPNYRFFASNFFNFGIVFVLIIFETSVASKVWTFTFHCSVPRQGPVGQIWCPADQVGDVKVVCSFRLWYRGHDGSLCVHPSTVIDILPGSGNISNTIQFPKGGVFPITVSWSGLLVEAVNGWLISGVRPTHCVSPELIRDAHRVFYAPSYFSSWQRGLSRLFHTRHSIPSDIFPLVVAISFVYFGRFLR